MSFDALEIGSQPLVLEELLALARGTRKPQLSTRPEYRARLHEEHEMVVRALARGESVYGVSTGVGASVVNNIAAEHREEFVQYSILRLQGRKIVPAG